MTRRRDEDDPTHFRLHWPHWAAVVVGLGLWAALIATLMFST